MKLQRMCTVCREMKSKELLFRMVRTDGGIMLDLEGKTQGRGAYICRNSKCIGKARKVRAFERSFSGRVGQELYDMLEALEVNE